LYDPFLSPKIQALEEEKAFTPEKRLLVSMVLRAWADLSSPNRFIQNDAYYWITSDDSEKKGWSFAWCCNAIDVDPYQVKSAILKNPFKGGWTTFVSERKKVD
jgi:hypothetical protein